MLKRIIVLTSLIALFLPAATTVWADDPSGAKLFATYCAACHGASGRGGFATAVGDRPYLDTHGDDVLAQVIANGTPNGMPAWGKAKGGTLTDEQIGDIVTFLRSLAAPASTVQTQSAPVAPATTQVFIDTKLALAPAANADGGIVLYASLTEYSGYPVVGAKVAFVRKTMWGDLDLGTAKTDNAGHATLFMSDVSSGAEVAASFQGDKNLNPSKTQVAVDVPAIASSAATANARTSSIRLSVDEPLLAPEGSLITPNPPLLPTTLFILVVLGVWTMYGYVAYQLVAIRRQRRKGAGQNMLRIGK
jgi:mono/diheme cytochrome c family protein